MRKSIIFICILMMAFVFVSCQTSNKPTPPATLTGVYKKALEGSVWSGTTNWKTEWDSGSTNVSIMIQKGVAIIESSEVKTTGVVDGNIIRAKSIDFTNCFALNHQLCWCDPTRFYRPGVH